VDREQGTLDWPQRPSCSSVSPPPGRITKLATFETAVAFRRGTDIEEQKKKKNTGTGVLRIERDPPDTTSSGQAESARAQRR
jgi:hypothetical protein